MHASSVRIPDRASTRALERRVLAESSLSSLARLALKSLGSDELVEAVARSVAETLDAERTAVIDVVRDANGAAVMRAGRGWPAATPLVVPMETGDDDLALMYADAEVIEGDDAIGVVPGSWRLAGSSRAAVAVVRPDDSGSIMLIAALDAGHEAFGAEELAFLEVGRGDPGRSVAPRRPRGACPLRGHARRPDRRRQPGALQRPAAECGRPRGAQRRHRHRARPGPGSLRRGQRDARPRLRRRVARRGGTASRRRARRGGHARARQRRRVRDPARGLRR